MVVSALALVAAAAGISGLMGRAFCEATLHVPHFVAARPAGAEDVELTTKDKAVLKGWWFRSGFTGNCVIVLHGIGDSKGGSSGFAPMFLSGGYSVLAPDSRAHGESGGEFVTYGLLERHDVIAWADWMRAQGCRNVDGLGESLIHGLADWRTPPEQSRELFAARPLGTRLWLVPGAGHTEASVVAPAEFRRRVLEWFGGFR